MVSKNNQTDEDLCTHNDTGHNPDNSLYYGLYIPNDSQSQPSNEGTNVFTDKNEVLHMAKQYKKARFKAFPYFHEAADFSLHGSEHPNNNLISINSFTQVQKHNNDPPQQVLGEKPSPFKGPKPQDLIFLRKAIERNDYDTVYKTIWKNPRYLIGNGDTPSILQEGPRYNALHIAAKSKNALITDLILSSVSNVDFVKLLYGDDNQENAEDRTIKFLDLYLNTPDKGLNETPLHFAVKYGAAEVVEVLVSYPQCDKKFRNKFDQTPSTIICDRCEKKDMNLKKVISALLEDNFYVPVLRAEDNSLPPTVGTPFSPNDPPVFNTHPTNPRLEIHAYAGPMNKECADQFRKVWKTPPRALSSNSSFKRKEREKLDQLASLKFKDSSKGLEILGKTLASNYDVQWKEYWPFLDSFVDITSEGGLDLLEEHLKSRIANSFIERDVSEFNNCSLETSNSIRSLCEAFDAINLGSSLDSVDQSGDSKVDGSSNTYLCLEKACQVFANRISRDISNSINNHLVNILDGEIKQLEVMVVSFMEDCDFSKVNFTCVHSRLAELIAQKCYFDDDRNRVEIKNKIRTLIDTCSKSVDCFSSDDEANTVNTESITNVRVKRTPIKKQLLCLAQYLFDAFNDSLLPYEDILCEEDCLKIWAKLTPCGCVLYSKRSRKNLAAFRNTSRKFGGQSDSFCRRLFVEEDKDFNILDENFDEIYFEEKFYTPPSTPSFIESDDEDDESFDDAQTTTDNTFIEGSNPTKTDNSVFNALNYAGREIDKKKYPNVYLWKHNINLFSDADRLSWKSPERHIPSGFLSPDLTSTPQKSFHLDQSFTSPPSNSKSWIRITGAYSPRQRSPLLNDKKICNNYFF